jgi:hypothetical protein
MQGPLPVTPLLLSDILNYDAPLPHYKYSVKEMYLLFNITFKLRIILYRTQYLLPLTLYLSICLSVCGSTALVDLGLFFSFLILYTDGRTAWTGDQPIARPLPTHRTTQTQNRRTYRYPCLEWDSNPRSQCLRERGQFMP